MKTILPLNSSPLQRALAAVSNDVLLKLDTEVIRQSKDPVRCEAKMLPWLAWENSIGDAEGWRFAENEHQKRRLVQGYIEKHALKGTPYVIRQLFRDMDLGEIDIVEKVKALDWGGSAEFSGDYYFGGDAGDWACYGIKIRRPITNAQAEILKEMLAELAPARCKLIYLSYRSDPIFWDGEVSFDGNYNFGAVL